jgi:hypothetical protein
LKHVGKLASGVTAALVALTMAASGAQAAGPAQAGDKHGTKPPKGCVDIDSVETTGAVKYVQTVCGGRVFILSVNETGSGAPVPIDDWQPFSGPGDPANVADATLAGMGANDVLLTVLTTTGEVFELKCSSPGNPTNTPIMRTDCQPTYTMFPTPP